MSRWPGKYVIGLTGNIATGKTVVRKMLEHLGAYGIDADALSHRAMDKGAPGYTKILKAYGDWILDDDGQIDRLRLANIVFSDPGALEQLESIVHPLVSQAIDMLIQRASQSVIGLEAIKLLETNLAVSCDSIWVVDAPNDLQLPRLMHKQTLSEASSRQRIASQSPQALKLRSANIVIHNDGSFENTWEQVQAAWVKLPKAKEPPLPAPATALPGQLFLRRGKPQDADEIGKFITRITHGKRRMSRDDVMAAFGEKAYFLFEREGQLTGLAGWKVENLVTRIDELYFDQELQLEHAIPALMNAVETASKELQSEASLLFLPPYLAQHTLSWRDVGYRQQTVQELGVRAWQEAATESMPRGSSLWFKRLREDRIMRPL